MSLLPRLVCDRCGKDYEVPGISFHGRKGHQVRSLAKSVGWWVNCTYEGEKWKHGKHDFCSEACARKDPSKG